VLGGRREKDGGRGGIEMLDRTEERRHRKGAWEKDIQSGWGKEPLISRWGFKRGLF